MGIRDEQRLRAARQGRSKVNARGRLVCDVDIQGKRGHSRGGSASCVRLVCGSEDDLEGRPVSSLTNCSFFTKSRQINDYTRQFVSKLRTKEGTMAS